MSPPREPSSEAVQAEEDRILRVWTPVLLRAVLLVSMVLLVVGLVLMVTQAPGNYVQRYHLAQTGHVHEREAFGPLLRMAVTGEAHAVLTLGLIVLTLVPLARVVFCLMLFLKERDMTYVALTAYVLLGLVVGVLLGQIG